MNSRAIKYSAKERDFIKNNCTLPKRELHAVFCKEFNRNDVSAENTNAFRKRNGWKTGRTGRYETGNIPHPNAKPKGPNKTSFKKGNVPVNVKPIGHERITKDGYIEVKVLEQNPYTGASTRYRLKHQLVWGKHRGKVPAGEILHFIDGTRTNCDIANLEVIPRGVGAILNKKQHSSLPNEIKPVVKTLAKLQYKQGKLKRNREETTQ